MRFYLCLWVFFLSLAKVSAAMLWVENNCTLERNTSTIMPAYQTCLKVRYVEGPGIEPHWETQSGEDQAPQDSGVSSYSDDGLLISAPCRLAVLILRPVSESTPYAFHYQSVDSLLVPPPPRAG